MKKTIVLLLLLFFATNLIYEFSHASLYDWDKAPLENNSKFKTQKLFQSIFGDVLILSIIYLAIALTFRDFYWFKKLNSKKIIFLAIITLATATLFEIRGLAEPRWAYNELMPTFFTIGVTPLIQFFVTMMVSVWVVRKID